MSPRDRVEPPVDPANPADPADLRRLAVAAALDAAQLIRSRRDALVVDSKSNVTDLVTDVDRAAEALLVDRLRAVRPHDSFHGEEGADRDGDSPVTWVLDPIDGTVNFVLGLPQYSVSVAAVVDGVTLAGCVVDVAARTACHAHLGGGAVCTGADGLDVVLRGPRAVPLDQTVVGTGFGYDPAIRAAQAQVLVGLLPRVANLRRLGSAALDLCHVAAGRLDAFYETGLHDWDRAAGVLVAREAGAAVRGVDGDDPDRVTVAAGPDVIDELRAVLVQCGI